MTVVFDSGVWISALNFGGTPRDAINSASEPAMIAICGPISEEIHRVLRTKFDWQMEEVDDAIDEFVSNLRYVTIACSVHGICRDPKDDMVLECAVAAEADVIVTGDKDLLTVGSFQGIRIITPRAFLDEFAMPADA